MVSRKFTHFMSTLCFLGGSPEGGDDKEDGGVVGELSQEVCRDATPTRPAVSRLHEG